MTERPGRWRRRLLKLGLWVVGLAVLLRIGIAVALPYVLHGALGPRLAIEYESLDLSILTGRVELTGLALRPVEASGSAAAEPLLQLDYAAIDLDVTSLLSGRPRLHRAELDGLAATLERRADGTLLLAEYLEAESPTPVPDSSESDGRRFAFELPFEVGSLRVHGARVQLRDASVSPPVDIPLDLQLRVTDLGSATKRGNVELFMWSSEVLQRLRVQVRGTGGERSLDVEANVDFSGLRPAAIAGYLEPLGIVPHARDLSFRLATTARIEPSPDGPVAVSATLDVRDLAVRADGRDALAVAEVSAVIDSWSERGLRGQLAEVRGVRGRGELLESGALRLGGVDLLPATGPRATPVAAPGSAGEPAVVAFADLAVRDLALALVDHTVEPAVDLELAIDEIAVHNLVADPERPDASAAVTVALSVPGIAESVRVTGDLRPFAAERTVDLQLRITGFESERAAPYLRAAGIVSELSNATLAATVRATLADANALTGEAHVRDLRLVDESGERLAIDRLDATAITIDPQRARLGDVAIRGLRGTLRWDADHHLHVAGLRTGAGERSASVAPPTPGPRFEVGHLSLEGSAVRFRDEGVDPPFDVTAQPYIEISNFVLGDVGERASLKLEATAPPLAAGLSLTGHVGLEPSPLHLNADVELRGTGVASAQLRGYLEAIGITPTFATADLAFGARARLFDDGAGLGIDGAVSELAVSSGGDAMVGARLLEVVKLRVADRVTIETAKLDAPSLRVVRDAAGDLVVGGIAVPRGTSPAADGPDAAVPASVSPADDPGFALAHLELTGGRVEWRDDFVGDSRAGVGTVDVQLHDVVTGPSAAPARFSIRLSEPHNVEELTCDGEFVADAEAPGLSGRISARGLRRGPLAAYLGFAVDLRDGRLAAEFDGRVAVAPAGGRSVTLDVRDFDYRDAGTDGALLAFAALRLDAPRIDVAARRFVIAEASVERLELHARRTADGRLRVLGLGDPRQSTPDSAARADRPPSSGLPVGVPPAELLIEKLDLDVAKLSVSDDRLPENRPFEVSARIRNPSTLLLHPEPDTATPLMLDIEGRIDDVVDRARVSLRGAPFAAQPRLELGVELRGVRGDRVADLLPRFAGRISSPLTEAVVRTEIRALLDQVGRSPTIVDLRRGFGLELSIDGFELLERPNGAQIAGFEGMHVGVERFRPATGDLHIRSVELFKPQGRIVQREDGLHLFGVVLQRDPGAAASDGDPPAAVAEPAAGRASPELRVDELLINDVDVVIADTTTEPEFLLPLDDLSVEVRRFVSGGAGDAEPFQFRIQFGGGQVELPKRDGQRGEVEMRPLFDDFAAWGRLALTPFPVGWAKANLSTFELQGIRGPAARAGVGVRSGILDSGVEARFRGSHQSTLVDSIHTFRGLSLDDSEGFIAGTLGLPAPLDAALWVLRDDADQHRIPLRYEVDPDDLSAQGFQRAATAAIGSVLTDAIRRAPFRIAGTVTGAATTVTDFIGITSSGSAVESFEPVTLPFVAGDTALPFDSEQRLAPLIDALNGDDKLVAVVRHELGAGDVERVAIFANPNRDDAILLATRLRLNKARLTRRRDELAAELRADLALGRRDRVAEKTDALRRFDIEIGATERSIDDLCNLLRPFADYGRGRRTREACRELGSQRLDGVRFALLRAGIAPDRIERRRANFRPSDDLDGGVASVRLHARSLK